MRLIDADALSKELDNLEKKYGIGSCGDGITICMEAVDKAPTIIDCGEMDHEELGKIPYMDLRPRMTKEKCDEITEKIRRLFLNGGKLFADVIEGDKEEKMQAVACLLDYIASLHNELYKQVFGDYYDYIFHWANLGYYGNPNDSMFKDNSEVKKDEHPENNNH